MGTRRFWAWLYTQVNNHIVLCHKNGATFNRKNRVTEVVFNGLPIEGLA
jgi:hypothetical protein